MTERPLVDLVIDEIVLRGVSREESWQVASAIEVGLHTRAVGWARTGERLGDRDEAARRVPPVEGGDSPASLGGAVAHAVWRSIAGEGQKP